MPVETSRCYAEQHPPNPSRDKKKCRCMLRVDVCYVYNLIVVAVE